MDQAIFTRYLSGKARIFWQLIICEEVTKSNATFLNACEILNRLSLYADIGVMAYEQLSIIDHIKELREKRNAVILAHNYQRPEVQDIADYTGDSLGLSKMAAATSADVIVFCGVHFMAETAKILSPEKKVLLPDMKAGCPMANMIKPSQLQALQDGNPHAKTVCYVNSSAEIKAMSDLCCTSSNAVHIIRQAFDEDDKIIFVPDKHLGNYVSSQVKHEIILWPGYCPTHIKILPEHIHDMKEAFPNAEVLVHPECYFRVIELADKALSTGQMLEYVAQSDGMAFIIGTERELLYRLRKDNPGKTFYHVTEYAVCPNMKKITLEKVLASLKHMTGEIMLSDEVIHRAGRSIREMLKYSQ